MKFWFKYVAIGGGLTTKKSGKKWQQELFEAGNISGSTDSVRATPRRP